MIQPKSPLEPAQIRIFKKQLLDERRRHQDTVGKLYGEAVRDNPESLGDRIAPTHLADLGTEAFEQSQNLGLAEQASRTISEIDRALERIARKTYGACENCGRPIAIARLEAIPYAPRCAGCQTKVDRGEEEEEGSP
jgi:RNA polymerase-binding protein DksA